jgi:hypothetical protein
MWQYHLYNALLTTDLALPYLDLHPIAGDEWPVAVTMAESAPSPTTWVEGAWQDYPLRVPNAAFRVWHAQAATGWAFRLGYGNPDYQAHFTLRDDRQAVWVEWQARAVDTDDAFVLACRLLAGPVIPYVLRLAGQCALHGSVVATPRGSIAFVGPAGLGKSTLATTCAQRGWPTLADDVVVLTAKEDLFLAQPGPPTRHLWPTTLATVQEQSDRHPVIHPRTVKRHVEAQASTALGPTTFSRKAQRLHAIFLLDPFKDTEDVTQIDPLPAASALPALLRNRYGLVDTPPEARALELRQLATLLKQITLYRLVRPNRPDTHLEVVDLIQEMLRQ